VTRACERIVCTAVSVPDATKDMESLGLVPVLPLKETALVTKGRQGIAVSVESLSNYYSAVLVFFF